MLLVSFERGGGACCQEIGRSHRAERGRRRRATQGRGRDQDGARARRIGSAVAPEKTPGVSPPLTGSSCTAWSRVGQRYTGPVCFPTIRQEREAIVTLARGCPEREDGASRGLQETEAGNANVGAKMPFFSFGHSACKPSCCAMPPRQVGWGWMGGACSRAHRARSDGADPVQQRYPRRRRLAWLDWPQEQVSGRGMGEVLGVIRLDMTHPIRRRATRRGKCCLSSKTPRIAAAAASGPNGRAILGAYDMKEGGGGVGDSDDSARPRPTKCSFDNTYTPHSTTHPQRPRWRMTGSRPRTRDTKQTPCDTQDITRSSSKALRWFSGGVVSVRRILG